MNKVKIGKIKHSDILKTIAGLFGLGKNDYADVMMRSFAIAYSCLPCLQKKLYGNVLMSSPKLKKFPELRFVYRKLFSSSCA